jgi:site-specific DNA recombinase
MGTSPRTKTSSLEPFAEICVGYREARDIVNRLHVGGKVEMQTSKTEIVPSIGKATVRAATYARYSTDKQDARSIDDQVRRCRGFAANRGFDVVAAYSDAAISGSHTEREQLQKLLRNAEQREFDCVLVDDLSRLSRDLGATWRIVFEDLASRGVRVIDCTTGVASDAVGGRLTFGALALVNDTFLQMVRTETHRGLEGRALAGFATGGKTYGFTTVTEPNPPDLEHPRKVRVMADDEAKIVRQVFEMYASGTSYKGIATALNEGGVLAPHDGGKGNKNAPGWAHSTVRYMLRNEQYVGVWVWNKDQWLQIPGTRRYRRIPRPASEHVRTELPELRIVAVEVWQAVQDRLRRSNRPRGGRTAGTTKSAPPSLLVGLLRCGVCGGSMIVVHRTTKDGHSYATLGCTTNKSRGAAICSNSRSISERKVRTAVLEMLKTQLNAPDLVERFVKVFQKKLGELQRADLAPDQTAKLLREQERRVKNLYEALTKMGWSEGLAEQIRGEEEKLSVLRSKTAERARVRPATIPHPKIIEGYIRNVLTIVEGDPARGREILARHIQPLVLTPTDDGYGITGAFDLTTAIHAADNGVSENGSRRDRD